MDQIPSQPTITSIPPVSPVVASPAPKTPMFPIFFTILFLAVFSVAGYFGYQNLPAVKVDRLIKDCLSRGGSIGESYPPQCFTPTPTPTQFANPTANWKTYTDNGYFYQIQYPKDWKINKGGESKDPNLLHYVLLTGMGLSENKNNYITVDILIRIQKKVNDCYETSIKCYLPSEMKKVQVEGLNGLRVESYLPAEGGFDTSQKLVIVIFEKNELTYNISMQYMVNQTKAFLEIFDQILSTFKFVEQATPAPTCKPRPACLDTTPRCMIAETSDMCPPNQKL